MKCSCKGSTMNPNDRYAYKMCKVCGDNPWTEEIFDSCASHPVHMCGNCADNHEAAREEGQLSH